MLKSVRMEGRHVSVGDTITSTEDGPVTFKVYRLGPILGGFGFGKIAYSEGGKVLAVYDFDTYDVLEGNEVADQESWNRITYRDQ